MNDTTQDGPVSVFGLVERHGAEVVRKACGVGPDAVRHWLIGRRRPSSDVLDKLDVHWPVQHDRGATGRESGIRYRNFRRARA